MAKTKWAHEQSDLPPDPAVHWGILPNGLRYAIRPNAEPKGRIAMRFVVLAGSLHEADDERGLAHFLEHMAFRRTKDHPEGTLIASLQRMGIAFGPDNTAFTNYDFTIYHLELPDSSEHTLREGLGVFREYADGLIFTREDVDLERGVVLSELSTRDNRICAPITQIRRSCCRRLESTSGLPSDLRLKSVTSLPSKFRHFMMRGIDRSAWF